MAACRWEYSEAGVGVHLVMGAGVEGEPGSQWTVVGWWLA